ncbi:MAG: hypothetical protein JOZ55_11545 [Alphaproteobacteria bacterium]|nr:hypothetical protein [Alphaproteobacteria bacterium]
MSMRARLNRARAAIVIAVAGFLLASAATAQVDTNKLYSALLGSHPSLAGFSPAKVTAIRPNESDSGQGMKGAVAFSFARSNATAEIRYALFDSTEDAESFAQAASERMGSRIFFPFMPNADCAQSPGKQMCVLLKGNVYILAVSTGILLADTHEHQTIRGISAGNLIEFAASHLQRTIAAMNGAPRDRAQDRSAPPPRASGPCDLLTEPDAEAVMGASVGMPSRTGNTCYYQLRSEPGEGVSLQFNDGGREKFEFDRTRIAGAKPLAGIGDGAFAFASAAGFVQIYAIAHGRYFTVMVFNHRDRNARRTAAELARSIASRLR